MAMPFEKGNTEISHHDEWIYGHKDDSSNDQIDTITEAMEKTSSFQEEFSFLDKYSIPRCSEEGRLNNSGGTYVA